MSFSPAPSGRRSPRLQGYDYRHSGAYFITSCVQGRCLAFGRVVAGVVYRSVLGDVAHRCWLALPEHQPEIALDAFIGMPDHLHGIVMLHGEAAGPPERFGHPVPGSLSAVVQSYKGAVMRWARRNGYWDFAWQGRYHDHIIRHDRALANIRAYIRDNPARWRERP